MPCDCKSARLEVLALKDFVSQWFDVIVKKINSVESQNIKIKTEIGKLEQILLCANEEQQQQQYPSRNYQSVTAVAMDTGEEIAPKLNAESNCSSFAAHFEFSVEQPDFETKNVEKFEQGYHSSNNTNDDFLFGENNQVEEKNDERHFLPQNSSEFCSSAHSEMYRNVASTCGESEPYSAAAALSPPHRKSKKYPQRKPKCSEPLRSRRGNFKWPKLSSYQCHLCPVKIRSSCHVPGHASTHLGLDLFQCTICEHKSLRKSAVKSHMITKHQIVSPEPNLIIDESEYRDMLKAKIEECFGFEVGFWS